MDVALMRPDDAAALREGKAPYGEYGPMPLMTLVGIDDFLLVCRDDFASIHAWLIVEALSAADLGLTIRPERAARPIAPDPRLPLHYGAVAYFSGGPKPKEVSLDRSHEGEDTDEH
jgi:hypothetical protein